MIRVAWCVLFVAMAVRGETPVNLFPEIYPVAGKEPPEILLRQTLTAADEQPKDGRGVISNATVQNPQKLPLGPNSRVLGTFTPQAGKGPVKLVLDWAGYQTGKPAVGSRDGTVVVDIFPACEGTNEYCGVSYRSHPVEFQQLFFAPPVLDENSGRDVVVDGKARRVFLGHGVLANEIPAGRPITVHLSFNAPPHIETYRLEATLLYGEFGTEPPVRPRVLPGWTRIAALAALLLLAGTWWRRGRSDEAFESDDPPKVLGSLLRILGLLWAIAGIVFLDAYSMGLGLLLAITGGYLYYGRSGAVPAMWVLLGVAWIWSIREVGTDVKLLVPRVGLITILWLWVVFGGTSSRLGTRGGEA